VLQRLGSLPLIVQPGERCDQRGVRDLFDSFGSCGFGMAVVTIDN